MIRTDDKTLCSGCGVCALVCPKQCIGFQKDSLGCLSAAVDRAACVDCGACEAVCPLQRAFPAPEIGRKAYAAYAADAPTRFRGASGGIFETVAARVIAQQGTVFASGFDAHMRLRMTEAATMDEVRLLTKSKYLQSSVAPCFPAIRERLRQGRRVLVCAAPCQIAALQRYLGNEAASDGLFLMDFFCHGVPSQDFFDRCLAYVEQRHGIAVTGYAFRSKIKNGATPHYYTLRYTKNGKEKQKTRLYLDDPFYLGFQKYLTLRDSCYHCPYGAGNHAGDLTVGDFHEIEKYLRGINRFDGVSTVLVNTEKGEAMWEAVRSGLIVHEMDAESLRRDGQIYAGGTKEPKNRAAFLADLETLPFPAFAEKWLNARREWKKTLYYHLPAFLRRGLKKLMGL